MAYIFIKYIVGFHIGYGDNTQISGPVSILKASRQTTDMFRTLLMAYIFVSNI